MNRHAAFAALFAGALAGVGCAGSSHNLSPTQLDALQVRDVESRPEEAFHAASGALIDAGYVIELTDADAGILTAIRRQDPSVLEHTMVLTLSTLLTMGQAPMVAPPHMYAVCAQVLPRTGGMASVRIRPYGHGDLEKDRKEVAQIWTLMQRHVLVKDPVDSTAPAPPKRPAAR